MAQTIPALTLSQPYATFIMVGFKKLETRSWLTKQRGWIAIHAGADVPQQYVAAASTPIIRKLIRDADARFDVRLPQKPGGKLRYETNLPLGHILGVVYLDDAVRTEGGIPPAFARHAGEYEELLGDYTTGRGIFLLDRPIALDTPIPARGMLNLWPFTPPAGFWDEVGLRR